MYNRPRPTPIRSDVANSLKLSKDYKAPSVNSEDYQGLEAFDPASHSARHKHGSHKQVLQSLDKPVVNVTTEKISEYNQAPIVSGIALSPEQLINYHNGDFR